MAFLKYEKLLNEMKKFSTDINQKSANGQSLENQTEEFDTSASKMNSVALYTPDDIEQLLEEAKTKRHKTLKNKRMQLGIPKFCLSYVGELSCLNKEESIRMPRRFSDINSLLVSALISDGVSTGIEKKMSQWFKLSHNGKVPRIVVVVIEGAGSSELYSQAESHLAPENTKHENNCNRRKRKHKTVEENGQSGEDSCVEMKPVAKKKLKSSGTEGGETRGSYTREQWDPPSWLKILLPSSANLFRVHLELFSSSDPLVELFTIPVSFNYLSKINEENQTKFTLAFAQNQNYPAEEYTESIAALRKLFTKDQFNRTQLLLNVNDMIKYGVPMNIKGCNGFEDPKFENTKLEYKPVTKHSPLFGVDCEMCLTKVGQELTSVSLVNENCEIIYATLVKPKHRICNYMTVYSGINKEMLNNVKTRVHHVQEAFRRILPEDAILVGHSIGCDLAALKMFHPYVIDTAMIYNLHGRIGMSPSLKLCCKLFMNKVIQKLGKMGHDPSEDAASSLQLAKLKLSRDITFGDITKCTTLPFDEEKLWKAKIEVKKSQGQETPKDFWSAEFNRNLFSFATRMNKDSSVLTIRDNSVFKSLLEASPTTKFSNVSRDIKELFINAAQSEYQTYLTVLHIKLDLLYGETDNENSANEALRNGMAELDAGLKKLYEGLPEYSLLTTIFTGSPKSVPPERRSNGVTLIDLKGEENQNFYMFRKL